jgi:hypothetical protein
MSEMPQNGVNTLKAVFLNGHHWQINQDVTLGAHKFVRNFLNLYPL